MGLLIETSADRELRQFKRDSSNKGKLMTQGLWSYSRHPNYFGEALVWWGFGFLAFGGSRLGCVFIGPIIVTYLLRYVSGVPLLERAMEGRPGFVEYAAATPIFVPRFFNR